MTFVPGLVSLAFLSLPIADLPAAHDVQVGTAVACDTQHQVERFVTVYAGDAATAASTVNAEEHDPSACGVASMAYVVSPPLATARSKDATFQIVKILVLGVITEDGVQPVNPAPFFSVLEVDECEASRDSAEASAAG